MDKAILVMDMPDNCHECPVRYYDIMRNISHCHITGNIILDDTDKLDWCPLIQEPGRMDLDKAVGRMQLARYEGWNACLDALEGKNDG